MADFLATLIIAAAISWAALSGISSIKTGKPFNQCLVSTSMICEVR